MPNDREAEQPGFARGTRLLTPNGYVPVEAFKPGDPVITRLGIRRAVRRITRRDVEIGPQNSLDARPVVMLPNAMGIGLPSRAVRLSPGHAVFLDGALIQLLHLVNGATIRRENRYGPVTYFHIELDRHGILTAEGLSVESCGESGTPRLTGGRKLAWIRRRHHDFALQAGFVLNQDPGLHAIAGGQMLQPVCRAGGTSQVARFTLPPDTESVQLLARCIAPAETDPDSADRRMLSICLRQSRNKQQRLRLGQGWHPRAAGDPGIWMGGTGEVFPPAGATELLLDLAAVTPGWQAAAEVDLAGTGF